MAARLLVALLTLGAGAGCGANEAAKQALQQTSDQLIGGVGEAAARASRFDGYANVVFVAPEEAPGMSLAMGKYFDGVWQAVLAHGERPQFTAAELGASKDVVRQALLERLNERVEQRFRAGCVDQVDSLMAQGWIICRTGNAEGQVNFGAFTVPATVFTWGTLRGANWSYIHVSARAFNIVGPAGRPGAAATPGAGPAPARTAAEFHREFMADCAKTATYSPDYCECVWGELRKVLTDDQMTKREMPPSVVEKLKSQVPGACSLTPGAAATPGVADAGKGDEVEQKLLRLKRLRDSGAITEDEFRKSRAEILKQLE